MATRIERVMATIDRMVPAKYRDGDAEELRRARLCATFSLVLASQSAFFMLTYLLLGDLRLAAVLVVTTALQLSTLLQLRASIARGGHHLLTTTALIMLGFVFLLDDRTSQTMPWFAVMPVLATLLSGRRAGVIWLGISSVLIVAASLGVAGHGASRAKVIQESLSLVSLTLANFGFAWFFESTRMRAKASVDEANREMRLVLDHVDQGLVTVDAAGRLSPQRSRALTKWFGAPRDSDTLWSWIARDPAAARWLEVSWAAIFDGALPQELAVDQLPSRLQADGRSLRLACRPLDAAGGEASRALVVLTDVTAQDEAERAEAAQRELVAAMERVSRDREGFVQFCDEAAALVRALDPASPTVLRAVHTLKGNCGIFGVRSVAERCHALESRVADTGEAPTADELRELSQAWHAFADRVRAFSHVDRDHLTVDVDDYDALFDAVSCGADHRDLREMLAAWRLERTAVTLGRIAEQARALAARLSRGELRVVVDDGAVRLDRAHWTPLWTAFVHAVRNAVDHGIETPDERLAAGKVEPPMLRLTSRITDDAVVIELADDGRGVDWDAIAARAASRGLACDTDEALHEALFFDGLSTRDVASETSGRGVGLAALRAACASLGGTVRVRSARGVGTTVTINVPLARTMAGARVTASSGGRAPRRASSPHVTPVLPANDPSPLGRRVTRV